MQIALRAEILKLPSCCEGTEFKIPHRGYIGNERLLDNPSRFKNKFLNATQTMGEEFLHIA